MTSGKPRLWRLTSGLTAVLPLLVLLLASCGNPGVPVQEDPSLTTRLEQVLHDRRTVPLREITGGDWDRVYVLPGENPEDYVEEKVGGPVDMPDIHNYGNEYGGLVVFKRGNEIQRVVSFETFPFRSDFGTFGANVEVTPNSPDAQVLALREPGS